MEFEYSHRWAELDLADGVDELEARDQALEEQLRGFGGSCSITFEMPFRWEQIAAAPDGEQAALLDSRDTALEQAIRHSGGCLLEFPYRWAQFWDALKDGEAWAIACAEENDRTIESRFGQCSCGVHGISITGDVTLGGIDNGFLVTPEGGTMVNFFATGWPDVAQFVVSLNGVTVQIFGPTTADIDSVISVPISAGDFIAVNAAPFLGGPYPISVFIQVDGYSADIPITWV